MSEDAAQGLESTLQSGSKLCASASKREQPDLELCRQAASFCQLDEIPLEAS